jgi:FkbM family methyltransferase
MSVSAKRLQPTVSSQRLQLGWVAGIIQASLGDKVMKKYNVYHGETSSSSDMKSDEVINSYFDSSFVGTMLDVGASHPIKGSTSYHFERNGWKVIMIEANPFWIPMLNEQRSGRVLNYAASDQNVDEAEFFVAYLNNHVSGAISALHVDKRIVQLYSSMITGSELIRVSARTLDWILENETPDLKIIDVVSIDVEDGELAALSGFDVKRWQPSLFVIENNFEDRVVRDFLAEYGYRLDQRVSVNDYFVRNLSR